MTSHEIYIELTRLYEMSLRSDNNSALQTHIESLEKTANERLKRTALTDAFNYGTAIKGRVDFMSKPEIIHLIHGLKRPPSIDFNEIFACRDPNCYLQHVTGNSMSPTLNQGMDIVVRTDFKFENDKVYAVRIEGVERLKRVVLVADGYLLISDNKRHPTMFVEFGELELLGMVTHIISVMG